MGLRDYRLFLCGLLLLSTSGYANGEALHLRKDRDCEHKGFLKKAAHAVLKHPPVQDLLKFFPRKAKKTRPTISAPMNPTPQENEYAAIDDLVTSPTSLTLPKPPQTPPPPPPPPFGARGLHSAPVSRVTSEIDLGSNHSLHILPSEKRLSEQEKFRIVQLLTQPNVTLRDLGSLLTMSPHYENQCTLGMPLRPLDRQALSVYVNRPDGIKVSELQDVQSLLAHEYENAQVTCVDPGEPIYENWSHLKTIPYLEKHAQPKFVENPLYGTALESRETPKGARKRISLSLRGLLENSSQAIPESRLKFYPRITQTPALSPVVETAESPQLSYVDLDWSGVPLEMAPPVPTSPPPSDTPDCSNTTVAFTQENDPFQYDDDGSLIPNSKLRDQNNNAAPSKICLGPSRRIENGCFIATVNLPSPAPQKKKRRSIRSLQSLRQSWSRSSSNASSDTSLDETDGTISPPPKMGASKTHKGFKRPSLKGIIQFWERVAPAPNLDQSALEAWTVLH
jgi:hypothetical protein